MISSGRSCPTVLIRWPALVARHDIEILTVAPELAGTVTCERETLTSAATTDERTRFYPRARTRRVAHGLVDLVNEVVERGDNDRTLVVERVDQADPTDAEWLAILLRRAHPRLRLVLTAAEALPPGELETAALTHATTRASAAAVRGRTGRVELLEAARSYVDSDGTSDDPVLQGAYDALDNVARAGAPRRPGLQSWSRWARRRCGWERSRTIDRAAPIRRAPASLPCSPPSSTAC